MLQMGNVIGWLIILDRRVCSRFVAGGWSLITVAIAVGNNDVKHRR